ncbi:hypothetical protein, conserved [Eimeria acervulina]|uniref:Uncharacterized protein n=1 Tax=Eimeria acervulina TaxID=5801 RepID=U6GSH2_EIMAC|nr:hypothetical protein, conserved [Eimeria acervulina]CDI82233.1 hypothetical protein, conserved [Eimeria acervulina]
MSSSHIAQELSAVRKQYLQQTAEVAKLSEQYGAIRASSDSAAVELAAARKQLSMAKAEAELAVSDRIDLMKENSHLRQEFTQAMSGIMLYFLKLEDERKRLLPFEIECERMRARMVLEETRIKEITEKHAETLLQLKTTLADEKALRHEIESQANEIATLATDLRSANQRDAQKAEQLRATMEEARRFENEAQRRLEDVARLEAENAKIAKELECYSKKHFQDLTETLAEKQKLKLELDAATEYNNQLSVELQLMKESNWRQKEELRSSREEITMLSSKVQELMRQADIFKLEATLEALRQELMRKDSSEKEALSRMRVQLQGAQQQHEAAVAKKKQLRTQLMEATRALHVTRVRNEEKQTALAAANGAAKEKDLAEKCATLETKLEEVKRHHEIEAAKRQRDNLEVRRHQQELASCRKLLQVTPRIQLGLPEESAERAEAEAAWARTVEEQVQQRVSVLEKDFALRIAKIRKKVAERAEYNHLLDELLAAGMFPPLASLGNPMKQTMQKRLTDAKRARV